MKDFGNLLASREINLTDLNFQKLKPFERSFLVNIYYFCPCSFSRELRLEHLKSTLGCGGETSCLQVGGNNSILSSCVSLSSPSSVNMLSLVKSTTELLWNSSTVLLLLWFCYCQVWPNIFCCCKTTYIGTIGNRAAENGLSTIPW